MHHAYAYDDFAFPAHTVVQIYLLMSPRSKSNVLNSYKYTPEIRYKEVLFYCMNH